MIQSPSVWCSALIRSSVGIKQCLHYYVLIAGDIMSSLHVFDLFSVHSILWHDSEHVECKEESLFVFP